MNGAERLSLRSNFFWSGAGNIAHAASQWLVLIVLAKLGTPNNVGQFVLGLAVTTPIFLLANLHLRVVLATDSRKEYQLSDYLALRCTTSLLALCATVAVLFFSNYSHQTKIVIFLVGIAKIFWALGELLYGFFQQHERMDFVSKSLGTKGALCVLFLTSGLILTGRVAWGVVGYAAVYGIVLFLYDIPKVLALLRATSKNDGLAEASLNANLLFYPSGETLRSIVRLSRLAVPAGLTLALFSLADNIPRYFIERYLGERELGIFSAISYFVLAGYMIMSALGQSAVPKLSQYFATGDSVAFRNLVLRLVGVAISVGFIGVLGAGVIGRQVLELAYGPEYAEHSILLLWLMGAGLLLYVGGALGVAFTSTRAFRRMPLPYLLIAIISTILSATLIPHFGLAGATWVLFGVYGLLCVVMLLFLKIVRSPNFSA